MGKVKKYLLSIVAVVFLILGITATFPHKLFKSAKQNPKITNLNEERGELKKHWNKVEADHDNLFLNNLISKSDYFHFKKINEMKRKADFKEISTKRKTYAYEFSFNGRSSLSYWLWIFGIVFSFFISTCFLAIKDARLKKAGLLKWYEPIASIAFIFVALFWMYHTLFKTSIDFEISFYTLYLLFLLIPISYFTYHFLRRTFVIEEKLLDNIKHLVSHVLKNTKKEKEDDKWELLDKISRNGK